MRKMSKVIQKEMFKKKNSKYFLILLALFVGFSFYEIIQQPRKLEEDSVYLTKCVDGDTAHFLIDGEDTVVRFLAIDTPEIGKNNKPTDAYGNDAAKYTCSALENAKVIKLEYEENKMDKYDRVLAWVWIDGQLLQKLLVEKGLASVKYLYDDYKYTSIVQKAEENAKQNKNGIWNN